MNHNVAAKQSLHNKTKALTRREKREKGKGKGKKQNISMDSTNYRN